jgi:hypothetical protein
MPKKSKLNSAERKAYMKENYARLRAAGYSSKDAQRIRNAAPDVVEKYIREKVFTPNYNLPAPSAKKQGAKKKFTVSEVEYKNQSKRKIISMRRTNEEHIKKASEELKKAYDEGYRYTDINIEFRKKGEDTTQTYNTTMQQLLNLTGEKVKTEEELEKLISELVEGFLDAYFGDDEGGVSVVSVNVSTWKPK